MGRLVKALREKWLNWYSSADYCQVDVVVVCRRHITQVAAQPGQPFQMSFRFLRNQFGDGFQQQWHIERLLHERPNTGPQSPVRAGSAVR